MHFRICGSAALAPRFESGLGVCKIGRVELNYNYLLSKKKCTARKSNPEPTV